MDPEQLDGTNLGRYVLYDVDDIGAAKPTAAKERLGKLGVTMSIEPLQEKFEQYFDRKYCERPSFRIAKLISAPDRRRIRRQFQSKLPRRLWDASTGPDQVVLHHNSFEKDQACLECIYPETAEENAHLKHVAEVLNVAVQRVVNGDPITNEDATKIVEKYPHLSAECVVGRAFDSVFRELCSAGQLRAGSATVLAPFSFISGLAGVLLYFEFLKSLRPDVFGPFQVHNYVRLNPMFPPNSECRELRPSRPDCFCQRKPVRDLFSRIWVNQ
jgi:ThiF family